MARARAAGDATTAPAVPADPGAPAPARKDAPRTMRDLRLATESRRRSAASRGLENPLREGLRLERVPDPHVLVLFGATGDLAHRKVVPALFQLWRTHLLPHEFTIVAVGRRRLHGRRVPRGAQGQPRPVLARPADRHAMPGTTWRRGSSTSAATSTTRRPTPRSPTASTQIDVERGTRGNRLYYLATQPSAFAEIIAPARPRRPRPRAPRGRLAPGRHREAVRPGPRVRDPPQPRGRARSSASGRSTASTTTWARRRSGTCWSSGSATASSSRSGTAATSTTCRSPSPSRSASRPAAPSTRRPAPRATSSRTTCSSCSAWSRWSRRRPSTPTRCATRRSRSCGPSAR